MLTSQLQTVIVDVIVAIKDFWRYKKLSNLLNQQV